MRLGPRFPSLRPVIAAAITIGAPVSLTATAREAASSPNREARLEQAGRGLADIELLQRGLEKSVGEQTVSSDFIPSPKDPTTGALAADVPTNSATFRTLEEADRAWARRNWLIAGLRPRDASEEQAAADASAALLPSERPIAGSADHWLDLLASTTDSGNTAPSDQRNSASALGSSRDAITDPQQATMAPNPFDGFMATWLSPADDSLRALGAGRGWEHAADLAGEDPDITWDAPVAWSGPPQNFKGRERAPAAFRETERLNPYLQVDAPSLLALSGFGLNLPETASDHNPDGAIASPGEPAAAKVETVPDATDPARESWRPPQDRDRKYFQNLNRF